MLVHNRWHYQIYLGDYFSLISALPYYFMWIICFDSHDLSSFIYSEKKIKMALLMGTHNICFHGQIYQYFRIEKSILSRVMLLPTYNCLCCEIILWLIVWVGTCLCYGIFLWLIVWAGTCLCCEIFLWLIVWAGTCSCCEIFLWLIVWVGTCLCYEVFLWLIVWAGSNLFVLWDTSVSSVFESEPVYYEVFLWLSVRAVTCLCCEIFLWVQLF